MSLKTLPMAVLIMSDKKLLEVLDNLHTAYNLLIVVVFYSNVCLIFIAYCNWNLQCLGIVPNHFC